MILPNLYKLLITFKNEKTDSILQRSTPFRVLEDTLPIIILNMITNMLVPIFPLICLINALLHLLLFAFNWKIVIKFKF